MSSGQLSESAKTLLYTEIAGKIVQLIQDGSMENGARLESERELAKRFAVGRNTVREAVRALENDGVLEVRPQKGIFIKQLDIKQSGKERYLDFMRHDYIELLEIKNLLEQYAARRLLKQARPKTLLQLEHLLWQMERQAKLGHYDAKTDALFHICIIQTHTNKKLIQYCENLIRELAEYAARLYSQPAWLDTIPDHRLVLSALTNNDEQLLRDAYESILLKDLKILNSIETKDLIYGHEGGAPDCCPEE